MGVGEKMSEENKPLQLERQGMQLFIGPGRKINFPYDAGGKVKYTEIPFGWFWINNGVMKKPTLVRKARTSEIKRVVASVRELQSRNWLQRLIGRFWRR